jgi:F-type H+-transporting ATPase subunit epsilon
MAGENSEQKIYMRLKILLPFQVRIEKTGVKSIVAESRNGSFGILPRRLDCVAALEPGIMTYQTETEEGHLAVDEGILVKTGTDVVVSVRHVIAGPDLGWLQEAVDREFRALDEQERVARTTLAKMESAFLRQLLRGQRGR